MVGIYAKIKNGLNWLQDKAYKNVMPIVGKIGDFAKSDLVKGAVGLISPALNGIVPGLGAGVSTGLDYLGRIGDMANNAAADYAANPFGIVEGIHNFTGGKYSRPSKGIGLARRPDKLHDRIKLKALPPADDETYSGPNITEVD